MPITIAVQRILSCIEMSAEKIDAGLSSTLQPTSPSSKDISISASHKCIRNNFVIQTHVRVHPSSDQSVTHEGPGEKASFGVDAALRTRADRKHLIKRQCIHHGVIVTFKRE